MSSSTQEHREAAPKSVRFAVITISDSRTIESDTSGALIVDQMQEAGNTIVNRQIVPDEVDRISAAVQELIDDAESTDLDVILTTGGTGISPRDRTPEAIQPLLDVQLPGFGEMFRVLSFEEIGPATMLSRAFAGRCGRVLVFCLPGSRNAVRLAIDTLLVPELPHLVHHSKA